MSEERERTQTLTVLTKPPPSQVMDPDVTLAWNTEPNPPFQTLGDTVYSNSFPFKFPFCCVLAKRNPFSIFLFPFLLGSNGGVETRLGRKARKWPQGMSVVGTGSFGSCLQNMPNRNPSCASCQPHRGLNKLHVALWKASSPRVAFLLSGWVNVPDLLEANIQGAQTWMKCTGLMRITLHFCLCFSEMQFSGGAWHWACSETQVAVSREVPGSHYQIVTQTPSALSGSISCYKGRGITCGVHSFLSLATWVSLTMWLELHLLPLPAVGRYGWSLWNFYLESTSLLAWTRTATQPHCSLKWLSLFVGPLGNDPWYS